MELSEHIVNALIAAALNPSVDRDFVSLELDIAHKSPEYALLYPLLKRLVGDNTKLPKPQRKHVDNILGLVVTNHVNVTDRREWWHKWYKELNMN